MHMLDGFPEFFMSVIHHWVAWGTGSLLCFGLWMTDAVLRLRIPKWTLISFLILGFLISCFQAWQDQYRENEFSRSVGSLPFTNLDTFWLDAGQGTFFLQVGIVLTNARDSLLQFHVDKLNVKLDGEQPEHSELSNMGAYVYPRKDTTFRANGIRVKDSSKRPLNGELEYMISYNVVGSKVVHHSSKYIKFDFYPPNAQYPTPSARWVYLSEHED